MLKALTLSSHVWRRAFKGGARLFSRHRRRALRGVAGGAIGVRAKLFTPTESQRREDARE